jgi:small subunit ribosomal protein S2
MPETDTNTLIDALFKVGAHFGFSRSRRHATMKSLVFGSKNRTDILDLTKTAPLMEKALTFVSALAATGKTVLFVGGKPEMKDLVKQAAEEVKMPYVAGRWLGGTLTNFVEIKKRVKRMLELTADKEAGNLAKKYTKKERLMIDREIVRLEEKFAGLATLEKLPDALIVVDTRAEAIPVAEANALGIPVVGVMNSDCDFSVVTYPIVGNDASQESVRFFLDRIVEAYREGAKGHVAPKEETAA